MPPPNAADRPSSNFPLVLRRGFLRSFVETPFVPSAPLETIEVQNTLRPDQVTEGRLVKVQHRDGTIDLYSEAGCGPTHDEVRTDPAFVHMQIGQFVTVPFDGATTTITGSGVSMAIEFDEVRSGRRLEFRVENARRRASQAIYIPAPPQPDPHTLRLLYCEHFWLFARRSTTIDVRLGGEAVEPASFGLPGRLATHVLGRAGTGLDTSELTGAANARPPVPTVFDLTVDETSSGAEFVVGSPLGPVIRGTHTWSEGGGDQVAARQDWRPNPLRRPAVAALAIVRRARRRSENWEWTGRDGMGSWTTSGSANG